jgi:hypothetical protein
LLDGSRRKKKQAKDQPPTAVKGEVRHAPLHDFRGGEISTKSMPLELSKVAIACFLCCFRQWRWLKKRHRWAAQARNVGKNRTQVGSCAQNSGLGWSLDLKAARKIFRQDSKLSGQIAPDAQAQSIIESGPWHGK